MSDSPSPPSTKPPINDLATLTSRRLFPADVAGGSGMRKLDHILSLPDTLGFVQALPAEQLYLMMRDIGIEDAYVLLEYTSPGQIQGLFDIDLWSKHAIQRSRWLTWLDRAEIVGHDTTMKLVRSTEDELLQYLFTGEVEVHGNDMDLDMVPDELQALQSPDGAFWVTVHREHDMAQRLPRLMRLMWAADGDRARDIFQTCRFELESVLSEQLVQWRRGRLEDMGFVGPLEALSLYSRVNPRQARQQARERTAAPVSTGTHTGRAAALVLRDVTPPQLLAAALGYLDDDARERVGTSFTALINKAYMARTGDISHTKRLPEAGHHVAALVNLGLGYLADESPERAAQILGEMTPETIFKVGYSLTIELALRARRVRRRAGVPHGLSLFGAPIDDTLSGAGMTRPLFFEGLDDDAKLSLRDFETLSDLARVEVHIQDAEVLLSFFEDHLGFSPDALISALSDAPEAVLQGIRLSTLFRTGVANLLLAEEFSFRPLQRDDVVSFLGFAFDGEADTRCLSQPLQAIPSRLGPTTDLTVGRWMERALEELMLAMGRVSEHDVDTRYAGELFVVLPEDD